jgi:hypothetical protein
MKPIDFDNIEALRESARAAYIEGNTILSEALDRLADAYDQIESLGEVETLKRWEENNGPASEYKEFFEDCFDRLSSHYPCPSVTSDYDKSVIFEAISKGERVD